MAIEVAVHHGPFLHVVVTGQADLADFCSHMDFVGAAARQSGDRRALIDMLGVANNLSFTDHMSLGLHAAQVLGDLDRVATVVPEKLRVGTSEKAAQRGGLRLRTFTTIDDAIAWLTAP
jgi:hypothetical protein